MKGIGTPPKDGLSGLSAHWRDDLSSGFVVFLLALPLSISIAQASGVPAVVGLFTAIIGGLVITFFSGSPLTIKGPAAGLIVIVASAVTEFGGGLEGWRMTAMAMVVAGLLQMILGLLKMGRWIDFIPLSTIHGMLAAIGLIIIAKQIPILCNIDPNLTADLGPIALLRRTFEYLQQADIIVLLMGLICLVVMLLWSKIPFRWLRILPVALVILAVTIPLQLYLNFHEMKPAHTLLRIGELQSYIRLNVDPMAFMQWPLFIKYVILLALVGSIESLLTVRAIDIMDPHKRYIKPNRDLIAIGIGNALAGLLGAIPMISEVARSSANVHAGAKTRWSNFFHGLFLLLFLALAYPLLEMIPNAALAAMLVAVGLHLIDFHAIKNSWQSDRIQVFIMLVVVVVTLMTDLLLGVLVGLVLSFVVPLLRGVGLRNLFYLQMTTDDRDGQRTVILSGAALFSNYLGVKKAVDSLPGGGEMNILFSDRMTYVDSTFLELLYPMIEDYEQTGGRIEVSGLDDMDAHSSHEYAVRRRFL